MPFGAVTTSFSGRKSSTSSRANLGGMMGNNSAGSRSIVYGKTIDHVRRLDVVLGDGGRASFGPVTPDEWDHRAERRNRCEGQASTTPGCAEIVRRRCATRSAAASRASSAASAATTSTCWADGLGG